MPTSMIPSQGGSLEALRLVWGGSSWVAPLGSSLGAGSWGPGFLLSASCHSRKGMKGEHGPNPSDLFPLMPPRVLCLLLSFMFGESFPSPSERLL